MGNDFDPPVVQTTDVGDVTLPVVCFVLCDFLGSRVLLHVAGAGCPVAAERV